jgi:predicted dinucleotide-binding enzyme
MPQQTIAIIGSQEKTGFLFTLELVRHPVYRLLLLTEAEEELDELFHALRRQNPEREPELISCLKEGCWEADIIILDTPFASVKTVADKIRQVATQKTVFTISAQEQGAPAPVERAWIWQELLPDSKVVAALNDLNPVETLLAGNDEEALHTIGEITLEMGFRPRALGKLPGHPVL